MLFMVQAWCPSFPIPTLNPNLDTMRGCLLLYVLATAALSMALGKPRNVPQGNMETQVSTNWRSDLGPMTHANPAVRHGSGPCDGPPSEIHREGHQSYGHVRPSAEVRDICMRLQMTSLMLAEAIILEEQEWHVPHRAHNRWMHIVYGNTATKTATKTTTVKKTTTEEEAVAPAAVPKPPPTKKPAKKTTDKPVDQPKSSPPPKPDKPAPKSRGRPPKPDTIVPQRGTKFHLGGTSASSNTTVTADPDESRRKQIQDVTKEYGLVMPQLDPQMTDAAVIMSASAAANEKVVALVKEEHNKTKLVSLMKGLPQQVDDVYDHISTGLALVMTPAEEKYLAEMRGVFTKTISQFAMMPPDELRKLRVSLGGEEGTPESRGETSAQPTEQPAEPPVQTPEAADPTHKPAQSERPGYIHLNDDLVAQSTSVDMVYTPAEVEKPPNRALAPPSSLPSNANINQYMLYRREVRAWMIPTAEDGFSLNKALLAIVQSIPADAKDDLLQVFPQFPNNCTMEALFTQLDVKYRLDIKKETRSAIDDFKNMVRGGSESLTAFVTRFQTLFNRAQHFGFVPDSEIGETLLLKSGMNATQRTDFLHSLEKYKKDKAVSELTSQEYLLYVYKYLRDFGRQIDAAHAMAPKKQQGVHNTSTTENVDAGKQKGRGKDGNPKRKRSRSRGRGKVNAGQEQQAPPAPKAKAAPKQAAKQPAPTKTLDTSQPLDPAALANRTAQLATNNVLNALGFGPGKGQYNNQSQSSWQGGKPQWNGGKKGKNGKKGKGKGKGKKKQNAWNIANTSPSPVPPYGWQEGVDWRCKQCNCYVYASKTHCHHCNAKKP